MIRLALRRIGRYLKILPVFTVILGMSQDYRDYDTFNDSLAQGWNTWNYESMLSHVLLPEALAVNLNLRPAVLGTPYDENYHFDKVTVTKTGMVRPRAHAFDGAYTDIILLWKGNRIQVQSTQKNDQLYLLISPLENSSTPYFIEVQSGFLWNKKGVVQRKENIIEATVNDKTLMVRTTGNTVENARPYTSPYLSIPSGHEFSVYTGEKTSLEAVKEILSEAKEKYERNSKIYGDYAEAFLATQSVLGWNTLYDADLNRVISPVTRGWNEAWQGFVLFEWDTYFASLLLGLGHKKYAYSNALAVTKGLNRYGAVAFTQQPRNQLADNSQPPVGSMVCWKLYEKYGDTWFLKEVYDELLSWNRWWVDHRLNKGYLTWGASWPNANVQDGRWESGLDNSPMYEKVTMQTVGQNSLFNMADVGLNSLYVMDCQYLLKMAKVLGKEDDIKEIGKREKQITEKVRSLWSSEKGTYLNKYLDTDTFSERLSPTLFYPMIAGIPSQKQARRVMLEHYYNPTEFFGNYMVPSISRNDPSYDNDYWRGAIWGPMNFLVYLGLKNYDDQAAKDLAENSYSLFMDAWTKHRYVFENINSEKGVSTPGDQLNCDPYYHWGALMGIMQFMEAGKY